MSQTHVDMDLDAIEKYREIRKDLAVGSLSIGGAVALGISHVRQEGRLHDDYGAEPGPAMLPELLLICLAGAGVLLLIRGLLLRRSLAAKAEDQVPERTPLSVWASAVFVMTFAACLMIAPVGFGLATSLLGVALCSLLALQEKRSMGRAAVEGGLLALLLYCVFRFVLSVPLS